MPGCVSFELFGKKHPYIAGYSKLSKTIPNIVAGMELLKQLQRKRNRPVTPTDAQIEQSRKDLGEYLKSDLATSSVSRSGKKTVKFVADAFNSYAMHEKNTRLRFVSEFGAISESTFVPGVSWNVISLASEKLRSCISSCSRASPLRESWEYVHDGAAPGLPRFFSSPACGKSREDEPDFVTSVFFPSTCDRPVIKHTKRVRLWSCAFRPGEEDFGNSSSSSSSSCSAETAAGWGSGSGDDDDDDDDDDGASTAVESEGGGGTPQRRRSRRRARVIKGLARSRERDEDVGLLPGCSDVRTSLLVEKEYALEERVVLPKLVRIVKRMDFDFVEEGMTWRYSIFFSWSGDFDEDAEYSMATDADACVATLQVEPLNLGAYMCSTSGPRSSSVFQSISMILKSMQFIGVDTKRGVMRCIHVKPVSTSETPSLAIPQEASDYMVWSFRARRIAGEAERKKAAEKKMAKNRRIKKPKERETPSGGEEGKTSEEDWSDDGFHFETSGSEGKIVIAWAWMSSDV